MDCCCDSMSEKLTDRDKWMHAGVCLVAALVHPLFALGLALGKEYGDKKAAGNHWCWKDLVADAVGIAIGTGVRMGVMALIK